MLFGKKEKELAPELLQTKNILINCKAMKKEEVIRKLGAMLVESGYVKPSYIEAMIERENTFATYMGNGIALPHGVEAAKEGILATGIAVMLFPEGVDWDGDIANVVIGIAGKGEDHLEILGNIATKLSEEEAVEEILTMNVQEVYEFITREDEN